MGTRLQMGRALRGPLLTPLPPSAPQRSPHLRAVQQHIRVRLGPMREHAAIKAGLHHHLHIAAQHRLCARQAGGGGSARAGFAACAKRRSPASPSAQPTACPARSRLCPAPPRRACGLRQREDCQLKGSGRLHHRHAPLRCLRRLAAVGAAPARLAAALVAGGHAARGHAVAARAGVVEGRWRTAQELPS